MAVAQTSLVLENTTSIRVLLGGRVWMYVRWSLVDAISPPW
jgi:hypothetical protein